MPSPALKIVVLCMSAWQNVKSIILRKSSVEIVIHLLSVLFQLKTVVCVDVRKAMNRMTACIVTISTSASTVWMTYAMKIPYVQILMADMSALARTDLLVLMGQSALTSTNVKIQFIIVLLLINVSIQLAVINAHPATVRVVP